jgi:serine protease Do
LDSCLHILFSKTFTRKNRKEKIEEEETIMKKLTVFLILPVLTVITTYSCYGGGKSDAGTSTSQAPARTVVITDKGGFADEIIAVAKASESGVVHIDIQGTVLQQAPAPGPFGFMFGGTTPQKVPIRALGSGVLISSDGYIITNNHVVENADKITVLLQEGAQETAKVVGKDPFTDLAVIKIGDVHKVPPLNFGDSDALQVGEWVVAIGNPQGLDWTVSHGIVSALHRTDIGPSGPTGFQDFIQTDAAINPGNSGGPLLNLKGEVIGLNSMIISQSRGSEGLGFAIPSNQVKRIAESLIKDGKVVRGELGINFQSVDAGIVKGLHLPQGTKGAVVVEVIPNTPAAQSGLQQGDVITQLDGKAVTNSYDLRRLISESKPGTKVTATLLRGGKQTTVSVGVISQPQLVKLETAHPVYEVLGLKVTPVTAQQAHQLNLPQPMGVVITDVVAGSPAEMAGLVKGDIIFRVGGSDVTSASEFSKLVNDAVKSGSVLLLIRDSKSGQVGYLQVPMA